MAHDVVSDGEFEITHLCASRQGWGEEFCNGMIT